MSRRTRPINSRLGLVEALIDYAPDHPEEIKTLTEVARVLASSQPSDWALRRELAEIRQEVQRRRGGRTPKTTLGQQKIDERRAETMKLVDEHFIATYGHTFSDPYLLDIMRRAGAFLDLFPADPKKEPGVLRSLSAGRTKRGIEKLKPAKRKRRPS